MNKDMKVENELGKLCLINLDGEIVVEPEEHFDSNYYPSNGLCQVERDGKYGYIDLNGKLIISLQYKEAYAFSKSGLAFVVCDNGLGGYINKDGRFVIDSIYDTGSFFSFGMAAVSQNGLYIFIYENGNKAINNMFRYASGFADCGLAKTVLQDGRQGLMDYTSKIMLTLKHGCELEEFKDGSHVTTFKVNGRKALVNTKGEIITGVKFDEVIISSNAVRRHQFLRDGLWGYLDDKGNEVIPNIYLSVSEFSDFNIASVSAFNPLVGSQQSEFYINESDAIIERRLVDSFHRSFQDRFSKVYRFRDGLALAIKKSSVSGRSEICDADDYLGDDAMTEYDDDLVRTSLYVIEINFTYMRVNEILRFIEDELGEDLQIIELKNHYIEFVYPLDSYIEPEQIEIVMYDVLDNTKLGYYDYYQLV